jgi:hypothetical protein
MAKAPMNPLAGVPGPGPFSVRNDKLSLGSTAYGEGQETAMLNTAAPKATTRGVADNVGGRPANPVMQTPITPIFAESQKKTEPIQAGIDTGDGPSSKALLMRKSSVKLSDTLAPLLPFDTTGEYAILYQDALARGD